VPRTIAIGDIHGCATAFRALLKAVDPKSDDLVVTLGDYVDRGPDSRSVMELMLELAGCCRLVPLLGNHDEMLLEARSSDATRQFWLECGGRATLASYGALESIPAEHLKFLAECPSYFETDTHFFVHGNYDPELPLDQQTGHVLRWLSLRQSVPGPHVCGKIAVVGHTPQKTILNLGHLIGIDTGCCYGGLLTALDVGSGHVWQQAETST
jgi:serine/threonine protein phosphatase 1